MKKLVSLLLCVALLFSLGVSAFAWGDRGHHPHHEHDTKPTANPHSYSAFFGDSIPAGYGLGNNYPEVRESKSAAFVSGTYPTWVANQIAFGEASGDAALLNKYQDEFSFDGAWSAMRFFDLLYVLGQRSELDANSWYFTTKATNEPVVYDETTGEITSGYTIADFTRDNGERYRAAIAKADYITLEFGNNDMLAAMESFLMKELPTLFDMTQTSNPFIHRLQASMDAVKQSPTMDAFGEVLNAAETAALFFGKTADLVEILLSIPVKLEKDIATVISNYVEVMDYIYGVNPDARVLVLGIYNPIATVKAQGSEYTEEQITALAQSLMSLDPKTFTQITGLEEKPSLEEFKKLVGELMKSSAGSMEQYSSLFDILAMGFGFVANQINNGYAHAYEAKAVANGYQYKYVDTSEVSDWMIEYNSTPEGIHPGAEAHKLMADKVAAAMEDFCRHEHTFTLGKKTAGFLTAGYTGDTYCAECGALTVQGKVITPLGRLLSIPNGPGTQIVSAIAKSTVKSAVQTIQGALKSIFYK